jgi:TolA-binding protein
MEPSEVALSLIVGVGLLGGIGLGIKAWYERRQLAAVANSTEATATAVLVAAARELVDPLREELASERAAHAKEAEAERRKLIEVRKQLDSALDDCHHLRRELRKARGEIEDMHQELTQLQAENLVYRKQLSERGTE